jgi:hypothetical protein
MEAAAIPILSEHGRHIYELTYHQFWQKAVHLLPKPTTLVWLECGAHLKAVVQDRAPKDGEPDFEEEAEALPRLRFHLSEHLQGGIPNENKQWPITHCLVAAPPVAGTPMAMVLQTAALRPHAILVSDVPRTYDKIQWNQVVVETRTEP